MKKTELRYTCVAAYKEMYDKIFQYVIENNGIVELSDKPILNDSTSFFNGTVLSKLTLETDPDDGEQYINVHYSYHGDGTDELTSMTMNDFAAIIYRIK